jgi:hypothetical protein
MLEDFLDIKPRDIGNVFSVILLTRLLQYYSIDELARKYKAKYE